VLSFLDLFVFIKNKPIYGKKSDARINAYFLLQLIALKYSWRGKDIIEIT